MFHWFPMPGIYFLCCGSIYVVRSMSQAAAATGRRRVFVVGVGMTKFEKVRRRIISSCRMCIVYVTGGALKANLGNIDLLMALSKWRKKIHTYLFTKCILLDLFFKSFKNYRTFTMNISVKSKLQYIEEEKKHCSRTRDTDPFSPRKGSKNFLWLIGLLYSEFSVNPICYTLHFSLKWQCHEIFL